MAGIRARNTRPELLIRSLLHRRGFRYRLHAVGLPGKPDIVLPRYRAVVFVHGCFWHGQTARFSNGQHHDQSSGGTRSGAINAGIGRCGMSCLLPVGGLRLSGNVRSREGREIPLPSSMRSLRG